MTTNYRTKPNPLLQYLQPGPTFPMHPSQPRHQHAPQMSAGSMHAAPGAFPLKGPSAPGPGPAGGLMPTMHPGSQVAPWMHQELAPSMYRGGGERRSTATHFYSAVHSSLTLRPTRHLFSLFFSCASLHSLTCYCFVFVVSCSVVNGVPWIRVPAHRPADCTLPPTLRWPAWRLLHRSARRLRRLRRLHRACRPRPRPSHTSAVWLRCHREFDQAQVHTMTHRLS